MINRKSRPISPHAVAAVLCQSYEGLSTVFIIGDRLSHDYDEILSEFSKIRGVITFLPAFDDRAILRQLMDISSIGDGDLLWIISGNGVHDIDFLARLTSSFADNSVQLGFGRPLFDDDDDAISKDRTLLELDGWKRHCTVPAFLWFQGRASEYQSLDEHPGSFLWRQRKMPENVWRNALPYRSLRFWSLYLHMASGGQIASVRDATVRFSLHESDSRASQNPDFDEDMSRFASELRLFWADQEVADDATNHVTRPMRLNGPVQHPSAVNSDLTRSSRAAKYRETKRHILIVSHGIFAGGAENFPIQLCNELVRIGKTVSMLIFKTDDINAEMRRTLDPGVSIYEAEWVAEYGCEKS